MPAMHLLNTVKDFGSAYRVARKKFSLRTCEELFRHHQTEHPMVPVGAWWDTVDAFLTDIARNTFWNLSAVREGPDHPTPIAGAVARYEPVLRKVPHYFFPSIEAWNSLVLEEGAADIRTHMIQLQDSAQRHFSELPRPQDAGVQGLVSLLEHLAMHPRESVQWAQRASAAIVSDVLVVPDLKTSPLVSLEGRAQYSAGRGCVLVPFTAHDGRLVGHGIIVYDRELPTSGQDIKDLAEEWRVFFQASFEPLIANLNSSVVGTLDRFFLGRVREIRHILLDESSERRQRSPRPGGRFQQNFGLPPHDCFVLNKLAVYDLIETLISQRQKFRIVFFDLDGFKAVNDRIGHQAADLLLYYMAQELVSYSCGPLSPHRNRWLGRFGGDEFIGIIMGSDPGDVAEISQNIAEAITRGWSEYNEHAERFNYLRCDLEVTTSMGWVRSSDYETIHSSRGLRDDRKLLLREKMRQSYALVELADTDTQERVKKLGKYGWLEFARRRHLAADDSALCDNDNLNGWLKAVNWLPVGEKRIPSLKLSFMRPEPVGGGTN